MPSKTAFFREKARFFKNRSGLTAPVGLGVGQFSRCLRSISAIASSASAPPTAV